MTDFRFTVTVFPDVYGKTLTTREVTLNELRDMALSIAADKKADLPLIKLAVFGDKRTKKNSLRHDPNVTSITGVEGDYDGEIVPFDQAVAAIRQSGLKALMYTSPRNTEDKPRWRILCPASQPLPQEEHGKLVARINGVVGGILGTESFTLSQSYYIGHLNGNAHHRAEVIHGDFVDLRDDLEAGAVGKPQASPAPQEPPDDVPSDKKADPDLVFAAMAVIPNNKADWVTWNNMGMATYLATSGVQRGFEAFDAWSRKLTVDQPEDSTQARWDHCRTSPPTEIGAGTIFQKADQAQPGWRALRGLTIEKITEILRLAKMPMVQYDTERKEAADLLGIRLSTLDDIVGRLCSRMMLTGDDDARQGTRIEFKAFEPWPDDVDGETLIANMTTAIRSHVVLSDHQAMAFALWVIHTHAIEVADHTPRLQIKSPTKRCGKSTLLATVAPMVPKKLETENISTAALFRIIEMKLPTLVIDEADNFLKTPDGARQSRHPRHHELWPQARGVVHPRRRRKF